MKLKGIQDNPELTGLVVERIRTTLSVPFGIKIRKFDGAFIIPVREIALNGVHRTSGDTFGVKLQNIEFESFQEQETPSHCLQMIQRRIVRMRTQEIVDEAKLKECSLIRNLAASLSVHALKWLQCEMMNFEVDLLNESAMKWIAVSHLLTGIPGFERIYKLHWMRSDDAMILRTAASFETIGMTVEVIKAILKTTTDLHSSGVDHDKKMRFVKALGTSTLPVPQCVT